MVVIDGRLVFDGDCGFCTRSVGWLRRLDRGGHVDARPLQSPGVPESVGATLEQCLERLQWLGRDGRRRSGAEAVNVALAAALCTRAPLALYRVSAGVQERAYAWVAANRYRLPGATAHYSVHPGECR